MAFSQKRSDAMKRRWNDPEYKGIMRKRMKKLMTENNPMKNPVMSEKFKGKGNPHYKNGIRTGKRMLLEIKKLCEHCGTEQDLQVHHLDENRQNNELTNLKLLCRSCHSKEHRGITWSKEMYSKRLKLMEVKL